MCLYARIPARVLVQVPVLLPTLPCQTPFHLDAVAGTLLAPVPHRQVMRTIPKRLRA